MVLPAPFGPISPTVSPGPTSMETSSTATMPPNRTVAACSASAGVTCPPAVASGPLTCPSLVSTWVGDGSLMPPPLLAAVAGAARPERPLDLVAVYADDAARILRQARAPRPNATIVSGPQRIGSHCWMRAGKTA